ncbi:MAG: regulatory protein RecX [Candidatus Omnitrophica bacterium]|nr:regulatory protein RecX [Candidatus Omnitrophota bacterium]
MSAKARSKGAAEKTGSRALNNAYSLLRMRPRSEFEIRERLRAKGYGGALIDDIVAGLKSRGDIDDRKFAGFWVDSRMHLNPVGDVVLRHELKAKGVATAVIDAALEAKSKAYDEYELALAMAAERFERLKKLDRPKAMKRLYDFLLRRGFAYETVRRIVEKLAK